MKNVYFWSDICISLPNPKNENMKKFITFLAIVAFTIGSTFAQTGGSKPKGGATKAAPTKQSDKKDVKADKIEAAPADHVKKDGTPDKRYKENKEAKPAAGPTKKDGTPDMRYKSNKDAAKDTKAEPKK
jgi:hypothetical protein